MLAGRERRSQAHWEREAKGKGVTFENLTEDVLELFAEAQHFSSPAREGLSSARADDVGMSRAHGPVVSLLAPTITYDECSSCGRRRQWKPGVPVPFVWREHRAINGGSRTAWFTLAWCCPAARMAG